MVSSLKKRIGLNSGLYSDRVLVYTKLSIVPHVATECGEPLVVSPQKHLLAPHIVHHIFYYDVSAAFAASTVDSLSTGSLRMSLAEVLSHYPIVAGRLARQEEDGICVLKYNDAGLRVSLARVDSTLDEWLRSVNGEEEKELTASEDMPEGDDIYHWPPFRLQLSLFKGGGLAIGVSCTHMLADPTSLIILLNSWMDYHNGKSTFPPHPPSFQPQQHNYSSSNTLSSQELISSKMATIMFRFSYSSLNHHLLQLRQTSCSEITHFDMLIAIFWTRITSLRHPSSEKEQSLSICTDKRNLTNQKVDPFFFGNALHFSILRVKNHKEVGNVAKCIHLHVVNLNEEEKSGEEGYYCGVGYGNSVTCMNMENGVDFYSVMLGENRPIHVGSYVGNVGKEGLVLVLPSLDEGGRNVMVTLPEEEIKRLQNDEIILNFEPDILLVGGGKKEHSLK